MSDIDSPAGGSSSRRLFTDYPPVTIALIVACVCVMIAQYFWPQVYIDLAYHPYIAHYEPYRFISSAFLHSGFWHLVINMLSLWIIGRITEPMFGAGRFLTIYFLSAIAGNVVATFIGYLMNQEYVIVGASGAIFGLFGALIVVAQAGHVPMKSFYIVLAINIAFSLLWPQVSWQSHLGGLITGALIIELWFMVAKVCRRYAGIASVMRKNPRYLVAVNVLTACLFIAALLYPMYMYSDRI
ncbi:rhomboid family intramembrane serine protease [Trueperella sp. LYQ143]|uniref:rhomboid family intramembrane serine protease n=1 Tax=unclassified Trueperella TaxID=2630174 RepID=UPI0039833348